MSWDSAISRRRFLTAVAASGVAVTLSPGAEAKAWVATTKHPPPTYTLEERLHPILQGKTPVNQRVTLKTPKIAEDGSTVPIKISVDSPMSKTDYVRSLSLLVDKNPDPLIFTAELHPGMGKAELHMNIRMAETSMVRAIVVMHDGGIFMGETWVRVVLGGCN